MIFSKHNRLHAECFFYWQVLVCTSTLAWGVNLPAHLVIIKVRLISAVIFSYLSIMSHPLSC